MPAAEFGPEPDLDALKQNMVRQFHAFVDLLKADPGRMQATIALGIYAHNHPELQQVGKVMYEQLYRVASSGLREMAELTGLTWSRPTEELGPFIISATNSITLIYLSTGDDKVVDSLIEAVADQLATYVRFE